MQCACTVLFSHLWPVWFHHILPHYLTHGTILEKKMFVTQNVCFDFLYNFCRRHFSFKEEFIEILSQMYVGFHVKCLLSLSFFNEILTDFSIYSNTKFLENLSSGSPVVPCGEADQTKLTVAFCNFANAPKMTSEGF